MYCIGKLAWISNHMTSKVRDKNTSIPKLQWCLGMDELHPKHNKYNYLSIFMYRLKLNPFLKGGFCAPLPLVITWGQGMDQ